MSCSARELAAALTPDGEQATCPSTAASTPANAAVHTTLIKAALMTSMRVPEPPANAAGTPGQASRLRATRRLARGGGSWRARGGVVCRVQNTHGRLGTAGSDRV